MFLRMLWRAALLRKRTALSALVAVTVAAASATAMLNLFVDVESKLRREFRGFGANVVLEAGEGASFSAADFRRVEAVVHGRGLAVPFAYAVARTAAGQPVIVAGTDFDLVRKLNPWWDVSSWPRLPGQALLGVRAAKFVAGGDPFALSYASRSIHLSRAGTLATGAGENDRIYIRLEEFRSWTGLEPSVVEIAAYGPPPEVNALISSLERAFPSADVHPVRQVTQGEANILAKTRSTLFWSAAFIILAAALCVVATLTGWLLDRRRDFAIMKAIGASEGAIALFIMGESAVLASFGALAGYLAGVGIAAWIGRANFQAPVSPRLEVLPPVAAGCLAVTLVATVVPLRLLRRIQPAMILRGE